ncbi:Holliday junction resolvase RuvX [Methylococcus sp. EFPC2]|uniref:Holliday junction resolvase RuvX n=1 Tax=Methylococcus sp. EFPC2 TaxID=2812648 RepID=UPI001966E80D|nr:Holliday junction resolvase RuvX [Methylococcus sp. EFPC2]QSA95704.1 Holliday junction resolvase RuvX [Methylococcus sp. EFPC2]
MAETTQRHDPFAPVVAGQTYLGFDFGNKSIGVAVGQRVTGGATALETIRVQSQEIKWQAIGRLVETWRPCGFVVGLAYQLDGTENPITQPTLRFCRQLEGRYRLPVYTIDETYTTLESRDVFYDNRMKQSSTFVKFKDAIAAQLILQTWLRVAAHREAGDAA